MHSRERSQTPWDTLDEEEDSAVQEVVAEGTSTTADDAVTDSQRLAQVLVIAAEGLKQAVEQDACLLVFHREQPA
jgi:hypothetical protein